MSVDPLDVLMSEAKPEAAHWPSGAARGIQKVSYTHDALIDLIIANPCLTQNSLAAHFGYTPGWISQVIASDAFQMRLAERKDELIDPTIRASVEENFKALVVRSMDILREKLNKPADAIPDNLALRTLELASRAAGYGGKTDQQPSAAPVNISVHLETLGENLTQLLRRHKSEALPPAMEAITQEEVER
jgi:hypothetical protein